MSDTRRFEKRARSSQPTGNFVPWRMCKPMEDESVRWECVDGRWVSITVGPRGKAFVKSSSGIEEYVDNYERALQYARTLRTL